MKVKVEHDVYTCRDCPLLYRSYKGPTCEMLEDDFETGGLVFPEGKTGIHPKCPFLEEE